MKCIRKRRIKMKLKLKSTIADDTMAMNRSSIPSLLIEMLERYCERPSVAERCDNFKNIVKDSITVTRKTNNIPENEIELELEIAEGEIESGRRLLSTETGPTDLLVEAAEDDDENVESVEESEIFITPPVPTASPTLDTATSSSGTFFIVAPLIFTAMTLILS